MVLGPFDAKALRAEIDNVVKSGLVRIDLDLSRVKGMDRWDSTALGTLVALVTSVKNSGAKISLVNPPRRLKEILDISDLSDLFK